MYFPHDSARNFVPFLLVLGIDVEIAFYVSYGRPMVRVLVIATVTYQVVKFAGGMEKNAEVEGG